jgi:methionyl-tRNA formyltransferase
VTNLVFLGTPEAAVPSLRALSSHFDVELVVTRPDRPRGRSGRPQPPPVKTAAEELGLEVAQPADRGELGRMVDREVDVGIVVAFGMILDPGVLAGPDHGFLNVHFSLLPRWRGAAPVQRAIMAGDAATGVSIMVMDEGLDTGPVVARWETDIGPDETGGALTGRLATAGADLLVETVPGWLAGTLPPRPQPQAGVTYADRIGPADRRLEVADGPGRFVDRVRALSPQPGARLVIDGEPHRVLSAVPDPGRLAPGRWMVDGGRPLLGLEGGAVEISVLQPPGKRPMSGMDWLRGRPVPTGVG